MLSGLSKGLALAALIAACTAAPASARCYGLSPIGTPFTNIRSGPSLDYPVINQLVSEPYSQTLKWCGGMYKDENGHVSDDTNTPLLWVPVSFTLNTDNYTHHGFISATVAGIPPEFADR